MKRRRRARVPRQAPLVAGVLSNLGGFQQSQTPIPPKKRVSATPAGLAILAGLHATPCVTSSSETLETAFQSGLGRPLAALKRQRALRGGRFLPEGAEPALETGSLDSRSGIRSKAFLLKLPLLARSGAHRRTTECAVARAWRAWHRPRRCRQGRSTVGKPRISSSAHRPSDAAATLAASDVRCCRALGPTGPHSFPSLTASA